MTKPVNYRHTLQLPKTDFPMRAGLPDKEPGILEHWRRLDIYQQLRRKSGREIFTLHDGPPYANGNLHIGHGLNKILKDMVVRTQQMMGKDARYVPGWDCHGLPIEWKVEENLRRAGKDKADIPPLQLRQDCRDFANRWIDIQREEFMRLGVIGNWNDPYLTMDHHAEAVIADEFMKFVMNGTLYQAFKPVMWSTVEQTALAEAEVEYENIRTRSIYVLFPLLNAPSGLSSGHTRPVSIPIWTTTPWTIPSNRAICYNPHIDYALYEVTEAPDGNWLQKGACLVLADRLADETMSACRATAYKRLNGVTAGVLAELVCGHPFRNFKLDGEPDINRWDYDVPMLPGDHVKDAAGTGFVHTAPSHGVDDYVIATKHGLSITNNVTENGKFRTTLPVFGGLEIYTADGQEGTANDQIIYNLIDCHALAGIQRIHHSYPHSWRSKAPLIYRTTPQWFVNIDRDVGDGNDALGTTIRARALNAIKSEVTWIPGTGQSRLHAMISDRPDWVLSRQRVWGVPLTCFVRKQARPDEEDFLLRDERVNARITAAFEAEGADAWFRDDAKERFLAGLHNPDHYEKIDDILDVWFESGSTHAFVLRDRSDGTSDGVADLYLEGTDQHRGWFHSSILQACGTRGSPPYRGVLTHGFTLDQDGRKMSKSLGNTMAPAEIVKTYGADILRMWVAHADYTRDQRIGEDILKSTTESYRRVRNAFRFALGNLGPRDPGQAINYEDLPELERWVLHQLSVLDSRTRADFNTYRFRQAFMHLFDFINLDLSAFYFDIRKDVLYCDHPDSHSARSTRTVLGILLDTLTLWLAPILTFTMEEVWQERTRDSEQSVHLLDFPTIPSSWRNDALAGKWQDIRALRSAITAAIEPLRTAKEIGSSLEAAPILSIADPELRALISESEFADICIVSDITITDTPTGADGVSVTFRPAQGQKCSRCWKIRPDVGTHTDPNLCDRCSSVLATLKSGDSCPHNDPQAL